MNTNYAGFWLRLVAVIIDVIIIGCLQSLVFVPLLAAVGLGIAGNMENMDMQDTGDMVGMLGVIVAAASAYWLLAMCIQIFYYTLMESSKFQGTLGKMALGIKVTDMNGEKLDFVKAFLRNLCKVISNFTLLIGYIMAGFTEKSQALHDMIAGTLVVKK